MRPRFVFGRVVFVGDRGMVTEENIESFTKEQHGFLIGIKRRRNAKLDAWLAAVDDTKWVDGPDGINARERKTDPPCTRAQEVPSGSPDLRAFVIDSDERRGYEQAKREQAMGRACQKLGLPLPTFDFWELLQSDPTRRAQELSGPKDTP